MIKNPFYITGYAGAEYFCDRAKDTKRLCDLINSGSNTVLMSPRRVGKTGLLCHVFSQDTIRDSYHTFLIDIYATKSLDEFVQTMGRAIIKNLSGKGEGALKTFLQIVNSLRTTISFDPMGNPSLGIDRGEVRSPEYTLDQIFDYLEKADKPCVVAIDEFQQITKYAEKNVEAVLRTKIQHCRNCTFIFSGSERSVLGQMFNSPARPFFASTHTYTLDNIPEESYVEFAMKLFKDNGKTIDKKAVEETYRTFEGVTWYLQKVMNEAYTLTDKGETCTVENIHIAVDNIINENAITYSDLLYQITQRQKELLIAICHEGKAKAITSLGFQKKYNLRGPSTIQASLKAMLEKQIVTDSQGTLEVYDKFLALWIRKQEI